MDLLLAFADAVGSVVCHQIPERSFFLDGRQLPVCARCTGLYAAGALGFAGWVVERWRSRRPPAVSSRVVLWILAGAAAPTILSYLTGVTGVWDGSNAMRAWLAAPLGLTAGVVVGAVTTKNLR